MFRTHQPPVTTTQPRPPRVVRQRSTQVATLIQKRKASLSLAARKSAVAVFISPPSFIKAAALPSPPEPAAPVYPQPTHFKGAQHGATTLSVLFNHEFRRLIVEAFEQPSGSNGRSPPHSFLASFVFIIFTLFSQRRRPLFSERVCRIPI